MNVARAAYSSTIAVPVDLLGAPWVGDGGGDLASHYYRARYYDSRLGRFVSEDPIGLNGGINRFAYVLDSPAQGTDPTGLETYTIVCKGGNAVPNVPVNTFSKDDISCGIYECVKVHEQTHCAESNENGGCKNKKDGDPPDPPASETARRASETSAHAAQALCLIASKAGNSAGCVKKRDCYQKYIACVASKNYPGQADAGCQKVYNDCLRKP